jgi:hypothetical protein
MAISFAMRQDHRMQIAESLTEDQSFLICRHVLSKRLLATSTFVGTDDPEVDSTLSSMSGLA